MGFWPAGLAAGVQHHIEGEDVRRIPLFNHRGRQVGVGQVLKRGMARGHADALHLLQQEIGAGPLPAAAEGRQHCVEDGGRDVREASRPLPLAQTFR